MKSMKTMTGVGVLAAALLPAAALAADVCTGSVGNGTAATAASDGTLFIRVAFTPKCSANVLAKYTDQTTGVAVASASTKGKNSFKGNSQGGAIQTSTACTAACATGDVNTALTAAEAMSS